jgi:hypothetical protein
VVDSILWAIKHTGRDIAEMGLDILLELLQVGVGVCRGGGGAWKGGVSLFGRKPCWVAREAVCVVDSGGLVVLVQSSVLSFMVMTIHDANDWQPRRRSRLLCAFCRMWVGIRRSRSRSTWRT